MCNEAVRREAYTLGHVLDNIRTQKMCNEAVEEDLYTLKFVPDLLETQEMCDDAVWGVAFSLQFVPEYFVTQQQIKTLHDDDDYYNDDERIEWYGGYKNREPQKAKTTEGLLPIAWYPDCVMSWCMSEDENRLWK